MDVASRVCISQDVLEVNTSWNHLGVPCHLQGFCDIKCMLWYYVLPDSMLTSNIIEYNQLGCSFELDGYYGCEITRTDVKDHAISFHVEAENCTWGCLINNVITTLSQSKLWLSLLTIKLMFMSISTHRF